MCAGFRDGGLLCGVVRGLSVDSVTANSYTTSLSHGNNGARHQMFFCKALLLRRSMMRVTLQERRLSERIPRAAEDALRSYSTALGQQRQWLDTLTAV
eukprot:352743-Chlamydomonas_euryale.AAC.4